MIHYNNGEVIPLRDIGKNIKIIRQSKKMTQEALADTLYVTRQTVSNYENGRSRPDLDMLLKIAEVLETDINTIIYGPPVPESKKQAYKWCAISAGLLFIVWTLYFVIIAAFPTHGTYEGHIFVIRAMNKEILLPLAMFLMGWTLMHALCLFSGLRQLQGQQIRIGRIVLLVIGSIALLVPLPYNIWLGIGVMRSILSPSVAMTFPYIPVYQEVYWGIIFIIYNASFVYSIMGSLFWLFGLPKTQKKDKEN